MLNETIRASGVRSAEDCGSLGATRLRLADGTVCRAELHWYEATGIGRREYKIKAYLD